MVPEAEPAGRRLSHLPRPETVRRFSDHPPMDVVKAAFAYALEEDFPHKELEKLSRWRKQVREATEQQEPGPTPGALFP